MAVMIQFGLSKDFTGDEESLVTSSESAEANKQEKEKEMVRIHRQLLVLKDQPSIHPHPLSIVDRGYKWES